MSASAEASALGRPVSEIQTDKEILTGSVVRVTSAYLLIARSNEVVKMPLSRVREIRRQFVQSPEADFLNRADVFGMNASSPTERPGS
jgi:hypothetical protein